MLPNTDVVNPVGAKFTQNLVAFPWLYKVRRLILFFAAGSMKFLPILCVFGAPTVENDQGKEQ